MRKAAVGIAIGLGILAIGFLTLGLVLNNQANFAKTYVHDQLAEKQITFTPVAGLLPDQRKVACLVQDAGKQLVTGKQAECYAKYQIGLDLLLIDSGKTYFQDHYAAYLLRVKAAQAVATDPTSPQTEALVKQSADLSQKAEDIFDGETMRGAAAHRVRVQPVRRQGRTGGDRVLRHRGGAGARSAGLAHVPASWHA